MFKYLFANPATIKSEETPSEAAVFTYHENSALQALLGGFLLAAIAEATVLHILLAYWNHWVALAATLSTVYVAFQIIAQIRAVGMRPIYLTDDRLVIRNGAFDIAEIKIEQIKSVEATLKDPPDEHSELKPLQAGFPASHNVVVTLIQPSEATILNRKQRSFDTALLAIDDANAFVSRVENAMRPRDNEHDFEVSDAV